MSQKSYNGEPSLYLIPTPIGNFEDITLRSINILKEVNVIFCEDTRVTLNLLNNLNIKKKLISNHNYNETNNKKIVLKYLNEGKNIGLVSDRGTPIISDPGFELSKYVIEQGYNVIGLPGATAAIPALISSGITPSPFIFIGFLNNKEGQRKKELEKYKQLEYTLILYESPHRLEKTLKNMLNILGNRRISISREISKKFEEIYRGNIDKILEENITTKGEFVIIVEGNKLDIDYQKISIVEHVNLYIKEGKNVNESIKFVAKDRKTAKNIIYQEYHNLNLKE